MTTTLAIGSYTHTEREQLAEAFDALFIAEPGTIASLDKAMRGQVSAMAYKHHLPIGPAEMDMLQGLGVIANFGVGYDAIDVQAAAERNITVTNTPDVLNDDVADLAIAMWISQGRDMRRAEAWVRDGMWLERGEYRLNRKMSGGKVGIMGLGRIGRDIADRLAAFKTEIHYHARSEKRTPGWKFHADPVSLARAVDTLFVALVGGCATEKYVSREVIAALGPRGVVINISRGSTIDEDALLDALESHAISGAGLDVFIGEPGINPRFLALETVVLQPHQGSGTVETRAAMARLQRDNIAAFLAGDPVLTPVD